MSGECLNFIERGPSVQSSCQIENFVNTNQKAWENRK